MPPRLAPARVTALEHQLRDHFGNPEDFGFALPLPEGVMALCGKVVLALVGADGGVSATERQAFGDLLRSYGAPAKEIAEVERFDPRAVPLESMVNDTTRRLARPLLYDAIRVARVDGFQEKERAATVRAARALGLHPDIVPAFEAQITLDEAVLEARSQLLQEPGPLPRGELLRMSKAILVVAAADGAVTEQELSWHLGQARALGLADEGIEELLKFDPAGERVEDHVDSLLRPRAQRIVFDALRAAHADGLHQKELTVARRAAKALDLSETSVTALLNQLHVEDAVRQSRLTLLRKV